MRRFILVALVVALALPASASAKGGAYFEPQLLALLPNVATREELYLLHTDRQPAAPVGSVPVVVLHSGLLTRRFTGSPVDPLHRSVVWIEVPQTPNDRTWVATVLVAGRRYSDANETTIPGSAWFVPAPPPQPRAAPRAQSSLWPVAFAGALALALVATGALAVTAARDARSRLRPR